MSSPRALDPRRFFTRAHSEQLHERSAPRRLAAAFALLLLLAIVLPTGGAFAQAKVRTDAGDLGGYTAEARGAPLSILLYEDVIPVPVDPGEPHGEGSLSYTQTTVETGPVSRAVASSFWPGPAVGDGFATLCDQVTNHPDNPEAQECQEEYRLKADSRYPSSKQFPARDDENQIEQLGAGMLAEAAGLDTFARASSAESPNEDAMSIGNARSRSDSIVEKGEVVATALSSAEDVSLGGGVISFESVKTELKAVADKKTSKTSGTTEVNGLVIGGQGYVVDEKGVRPVENNKPSDAVTKLPAMPGGAEMRKQLGIEVELVKHEQQVNGADALRKAGGLKITIDSSVLKKAITDNVPVDDVLGELPEQTDEITANLAPLMALAPKIEFIFGRAQVRAAGTEAMEFDFPLLPPLNDPVAPTGTTTTGGSSGTPAVSPAAPVGGTTGGAAAPAIAPADTGGGGPAIPSAAPPAAAPAAVVAQTAAAELPAFFGGLPPGLVAAGVLLAALGGKALAGFTGMAMSGVVGSICDRGLLRKVPNLRT